MPDLYLPDDDQHNQHSQDVQHGQHGQDDPRDDRLPGGLADIPPAMDRLDRRPVAEHVEVFEAVHRQLRQVLDAG